MKNKIIEFFNKNFAIIEVLVSIIIFGSLFFSKIINNHEWLLFDDILSFIILLLLSWFSYKEKREKSAKILLVLALCTIFGMILDF